MTYRCNNEKDLLITHSITMILTYYIMLFTSPLAAGKAMWATGLGSRALPTACMLALRSS